MYNKLLLRGEHVSLITFMSTADVLDRQLIHGSEAFVEKILLPMLFDGKNPHSIAIHHLDEIVDMIHGLFSATLFS